jgi:predicted enzyme related to lactoylglutathione lyase
MPVSLFAVVVDCRDPQQLAQFWADALRWRSTRRNEGEYQVSDPSPGPTSLYFMGVPEPKVVKNRLHLDVLADGSTEAEVERLIELGAELVEVRRDPDSFDNPDSWTVLTDPEGNEFCVTSTATLTGWA